MRVLHSGKPANVNDFTFFMSPIVFTPYFFAVDVSIAERVRVVERRLRSNSVLPRLSSNFFAAA